MADHVQVPVKTMGSGRWGLLSSFGDAHLICGETVKLKDENYSCAGGHRVRLYSFKKNVHWRIPEGISLDIAEVAPATAPRRKQR